ncbi:uncharacterized protein LOC141598919 [Silene latifolia]|uniref:uncharacterized protein LOC141598919 n=1 Tax=Silene latifolia TaxID=37657 RepID=UPI003D77F427
MLNGEGGMRKKRRMHEFEGRKLPCGVTREYGKFRVQIWHSVLKKYVSCGAYSTCEEAAVVADRKMTELRELYGGKPRGSSECEDEDMILQETQSETEEAALVVKNKKAEFEEMLKGVDGLREKRRKHEFEGRKKRPCGVRRENGKFRVRIWHPVLKRDVSFGTYSTCEEAAVVAVRKRTELWELYGGKPRGSSECEDDDKVLQETESETEEAALVVKNKKAEFEGMLKGVDGLREKRRKHEFEGRKKRPFGVRRENEKFRVRFWHPVLKRDVSFGTYSTCEEAAVVADRKRAELRELYGGKPRGGSECEDDDKVLQETESESEEAALVVKTKKAEFEGTLKGVDGLREKRRRHEFEGRKLPCGLRRENGKFRVRFWHPVLKRDVSFGTYSTYEEAAVIADRKRAELRELYGGKPTGSSECEVDDKVLQETESETEEAALVADRKTADLEEVYGGKVRGSSECEDGDEILQEIESKVAGKFEYANEQTSGLKLPAGVRRVRSGKRVARFKYPGSWARIWLGTSDTAEEAIQSYDKNVAVQMGYDGLNNVENDDKPNCGVVDVPDKLECEFVQGFPTSNIEPGTTNSACVRHKIVIDKTSQRKTTCCLDFDEAVSAGFINEYGQLVGKYRELDEQLFLGLTDENFAAS